MKPFLKKLKQNNLWVDALIILVFAYQALSFAFFTPMGIPPDEDYHYKVISLFAEGDTLLPAITEEENLENLKLGSVRTEPSFFYHALMSIPYRVIHSFDLHQYDRIILRMINIMISISSMIASVFFFKQVYKSDLLRHVSLLLFSSILMFIFISSAISYDNLQILLAILSYIFITRLNKKYTINNLLILSNLWLAIFLTKWTAVPIIFAEVLIVIYITIKQKELIKKLKSQVTFNWQSMLLVLLTLFLVTLFSTKIFTNIINYHTPTPQCDAVLTLDQCLNNGPFRRNYKFVEEDRPITMGMLTFAFNWVRQLLNTIHGILAHRSLQPLRYGVLSYLFIYIAGIVSFIRYGFTGKVRNKEHDFMFLGIIVVYVLSLFLKNFSEYLKFGVFGVAVQGRYLFPVFIPIIFIINRYLEELLGTKLTKLFFAIVICIAIFSGAYTFYTSVGTWWFII